MGEIRLPFFIFASLTIVLAVAFEISTMAFLRSAAGVEGSIPGLGGPYLALIDGIILYSIILMWISMAPGKAITARVQSVVTLILSLFGAFGSFVLIFVAFGLILLMIGLLLAVPFGTIAYFAAYADFPKSVAVSALTFVMMLKLAFLILLFLAHQGFMKNIGLVIMIGLSLLTTWLTSFLIALPPGFLASITDAVAALITAVVAFIRLVMLFIASLIGIITAISFNAPGKER